jgi:uncharacterized protein
MIAVSPLIFMLYSGLGVWQNQGSCIRDDDGNCITYELAATVEERVRGLSGRSTLPRNTAKLFIFDSLGEHCMWMKDMNFAIDIIWLNKEYEVVDIAQNITPDTFPASFCSTEPAKYVVELNTGMVKMNNLRIGDRLDISSP